MKNDMTIIEGGILKKANNKGTEYIELDGEIVSKCCCACGEMLTLDKFGNNGGIGLGKKKSKCTRCLNEVGRKTRTKRREQSEQSGTFIVENTSIVGTLKISVKNVKYIESPSGELMAKRCTKCNELRLIDSFNPSPKNHGGRLPECKACVSFRLSRKCEEFTQYKRLTSRRFRDKHKDNPEYIERMKISRANRKAFKNALPNDLTEEQYNENKSYFNNRCALTDAELDNCHLEHAIPLFVGHGGTTITNCYPLRGDLNTSKCDRNIFEWFTRFGERYELSQSKFDHLVDFLARKNGLTVEQYRDFVYWCHDNPRTVEDIKHDPRTSIELWNEAAVSI